MKNIKLIVGGSIGYFIGALFNSILVIMKETNESVEEFLVNVFGHHWIGHGILVLIVFFIFTAIGAVFYTGGEDEGLFNKLIWLVVTGTVLSLLIIVGFNVIHFLG
jgi:membrane-bound acyltransferase YfiQ involved in biofilm formation